MKRYFLIWIATVALFSVSACTTSSMQQKGTGTGAVVGAGLGALLGQAIGGNTESTLVGAGIGAFVGGVAGNQIGAYMDHQEQALRHALAASEAASIQREQDILTASFRSDIFFDFNSAAIRPGGYRELERVSSVLRQYPQTLIRVEGHTDAVGSEAYNQRLSKQRAEAVKMALTQMGVASSRIYTVGLGETQSVSSSPDINRRVNIVIMPHAVG